MTCAYVMVLADAQPWLQHWSQLPGGTPPGPPGTHVSSELSKLHSNPWYLDVPLAHGSRVAHWIHLWQINCGPLERHCPKGDSHSLPGASTLNPPYVLSKSSKLHFSSTFFILTFISPISIQYSYLQVLKSILYPPHKFLQILLDFSRSSIWNPQQCRTLWNPSGIPGQFQQNSKVIPWIWSSIPIQFFFPQISAIV